MSEEEPYNPLAKSNLGESVADALLRVAVKPLRETSPLVGAGVYAIYYTGGFPAYGRIKQMNVGKRFTQPIYVGKAVPKGSRKGGTGYDSGTGKAMRDRLRQHAMSINEASNLDLDDFYYRALMVDDIWIPLGENVVIEKFQPLWNRVIDGFGNKTPGKRRAGQWRSTWDALHPGRAFVKQLKLGQHPMSVKQIRAKIEKFFAGKLADAEKLAPGEE